MVQKLQIEKKLADKSVVIVSHFYSQGPGSRLEDYLVPKIKNLTYIGHPFYFSQDKRSFYKVYKDGKLIIDKKSFKMKGPEFLFWIRDVVITYIWFFRIKHKIDYCFAFDSLLTNVIYPFRFFNRIHTLIFYTIDFVPFRFPNKLLNDFYHYLEKSAVQKSDFVWNLSSRMVEAREKEGYDKKYRKKQITVPIGTDIHRKPLPFNKIDRYKIVYLGSIGKQHGVLFLIEAMAEVVKKLPKAHLLLIGGGPHITLAEKLIKDLKLSKQVKLTGFVEKFSEVQDYMNDAAIAVAPYLDNEKSFTRFTDPGKPKDYLSGGLPVIITKVPEVAYEIDKKKCGIAIDYDKKQFVNAVTTLLKDTEKLKQYKENAYNFAQGYTWDKVFDRAFQELFNMT